MTIEELVAENDKLKRQLAYESTALTMMKADYNARLKSDMVAMLTELQLEIEEREQHYKDKFLEPNNAVHEAAMGGRMFGCGECKDIIQQKIDKLKEQEDGTNNN